MGEPLLSVREISKNDIDLIASYWLDSERSFLEGMGVLVEKIPSREQWHSMLNEQLKQTYEEKQSYCIIWQVDGKPIGHSNVNKIIFGNEAYMHLHIWNSEVRKKGWGSVLIKKTLPYFFENMRLKKLFCEPNALNPAPNKTLEKVGFGFVKKYQTIPGWLNVEQEVNLWELSYEQFIKII